MDIPCAHAPCVKGDYFFFDAGNIPLVFGNKLWLKLPVAVPGDIKRELSKLAFDSFLRIPIYPLSNSFQRNLNLHGHRIFYALSCFFMHSGKVLSANSASDILAYFKISPSGFPSQSISFASSARSFIVFVSSSGKVILHFYISA